MYIQVFLGSYFGYKKEVTPFPVRTNQVRIMTIIYTLFTHKPCIHVYIQANACINNTHYNTRTNI